MTGRAKAASDPFWATSLSKMQSGVQGIVKGLYGVIQRSKTSKDLLWVGSGWRSESKEHATGRAVDVVLAADVGAKPTKAERAAGNSFVNWLIRNADELKIKGIIFSRDGKPRPELWGYSTPGKWRAFPDRGSISLNHVDHVHIFFKPGASWPASLNTATLKPGLPKVGDAGVKVVGSVSVAHLKSARYADPSKSGRPVGDYGDEVYTLETALAKTGWLESEYVDGHYGSTTVGNGSSGYGGVTGFQKKHSKASVPDGWLSRKELTKLFSLAGMLVKVTE